MIEGDHGQRSAVLTLSLDKPSGQRVDVDIASFDGSAIAGEDYVALLLATVSLTPGQTTKRVTIGLIGDLLPEPAESFAVHLSNAVNAVIGKDTGTVKILGGA